MDIKVDVLLDAKQFLLPYGQYFIDFFWNNKIHFFIEDSIIFYLLIIFIGTFVINLFLPKQEAKKEINNEGQKRKSVISNNNEPSPFLPYLSRGIEVIANYSFLTLLFFSIRKILIHFYQIEQTSSAPYLLKPVTFLYVNFNSYTDSIIKITTIALCILLFCEVLHVLGFNFLKWIPSTIIPLFIAIFVVGTFLFTSIITHATEEQELKWEREMLQPYLETLQGNPIDIEVKTYKPYLEKKEAFISVEYVDEKTGKKSERSGTIPLNLVLQTEEEQSYMVHKTIPKTINEFYQEGQTFYTIYLNQQDQIPKYEEIDKN